MHKVLVHDEHETSFALLHNRLFENVLVIGNEAVIAILLVCLEILFGCFGITLDWGTEAQDSRNFRIDVGNKDWSQFSKCYFDIYMTVNVRPSDPTNNGCCIAIKVQKTRQCYGFPILSDCNDLIPIRLEPCRG